MRKYSPEEFLKAAEIGEVSMIDARNIVSLLRTARAILNEEKRFKKYALPVSHDKIKNVGNLPEDV